MKRKIGFVAAVILVGAFVVACNQKPAEPTATPAPSPTPAATEKPATSDLPSDSVIVEDTGLSQPVAQETEEQTPTNEGATYESDVEQQTSYSAETQRLFQKLLDLGMTREEAEQAMAEAAERGQQAAAEEQQRLEESSAAAQERIAQEFAESAKATNNYYLERYGITKDQAMGMPSEELNALFDQKHGG